MYTEMRGERHTPGLHPHNQARHTHTRTLFFLRDSQLPLRCTEAYTTATRVEHPPHHADAEKGLIRPDHGCRKSTQGTRPALYEAAHINLASRPLNGHVED